MEISSKEIRLRRSESEWHEFYLEHQSSGLSMSEFCRQKSIPSSSYMKWKKKFSCEKGSFKKLKPLKINNSSKRVELSLAGSVNLVVSL